MTVSAVVVTFWNLFLFVVVRVNPDLTNHLVKIVMRHRLEAINHIVSTINLVRIREQDLKAPPENGMPPFIVAHPFVKFIRSVQLICNIFSAHTAVIVLVKVEAEELYQAHLLQALVVDFSAFFDPLY